MSRIALILLAAGGSRRMGAPKQLLDWRGMPLVRHAALAALSSRCRPVVAVTGGAGESVRAALDGLAVRQVEHPDWETGMGGSVQAGLRALDLDRLDGVVVALADQPLVGASVYDSLVARHCLTGRPIVAARYAGTLGVPAFFAASLFPALRELPPEQGCRALLRGNPSLVAALDCPEASLDIDTPADYDLLVASNSGTVQPWTQTDLGRSLPMSRR